MIHDDLLVDEYDVEKYKNQINEDYEVDDCRAMKMVYETLLFRKLKNSESSDILEKGNDFGAGFN
jgi:hypothetical protein